jgi:AcrR family transcriptional regulator
MTLNKSIEWSIMFSGRRASDTNPLSREDWVRGAVVFLSRNNVDALRIDSLCKYLGVTKGSFYWHFESREALLDAVLETWRVTMINDIEAWLRTTTGTPMSRLKRLLRIAISPRIDVPGGPFELTLRDWARRDSRVDEIVRLVDAERLTIVRNLYVDIGLEPERADTYALMHMTYVVGGRTMLFSDDPKEIERRWRIAEAYLLPSSD